MLQAGLQQSRGEGMKRILSVLLSAALFMTGCVFASAEGGSVYYEGDAGEFIFAPGSEHSPTDMFVNFKDVMPGDSITQPITIRNDASNKVKVKVFMRSLGAQDDSREFLSQLGLRVVERAENPMPYMFDARADETAQLAEWTYLGTLYSGGEIYLDVILDVPVTLDNTYKNMIGKLDWQFMIEELPIEPDDPTPPDTGDKAEIGVWSAMFAVTLTVLALLLIVYKKRRKDTDQ